MPHDLKLIYLRIDDMRTIVIVILMSILMTSCGYRIIKKDDIDKIAIMSYYSGLKVCLDRDIDKLNKIFENKPEKSKKNKSYISDDIIEKAVKDTDEKYKEDIERLLWR